MEKMELKISGKLKVIGLSFVEKKGISDWLKERVNFLLIIMFYILKFNNYLYIYIVFNFNLFQVFIIIIYNILQLLYVQFNNIFKQQQLFKIKKILLYLFIKYLK
ncbi:hypothetical protein IMG5_056820 [Ichthyophthirius multifiliis]|uniref:Uncharacterized protein n=1 Tax=Ichthyophthirius multifiliis TaxID=5932 RepID=G0QNB1_ICHMU|nr:hypothetical protein IMG5_056820 [Ichthyophthirius multifiliis]EGR33303.1 hypothetical protein IMG5_056820 [Ichthyophthirius multifiliis]|eukprot:XP_004037289.1 hypothetical protein IMG5_056820 [Ichthyophthirius multifiliis]